MPEYGWVLMRISLTIFMYIGRLFLANFVVLLAAILLIILLFDVIELLRRTHAQIDVSFLQILEMASLKLPIMGQQVFPLAALFGCMLTFWKLARHHELVVTRAAGISAWQFLLPVVMVSLGLGLFQMGILNHVASKTLAQYDKREALLLKGSKSLLALSGSAIWLRQANPKGQAVIRASRIITDNDEITLYSVVVFVYRGIDTFFERIDAEQAVLEDGFWRISNAWVQRPEEVPRLEPTIWLETDLTFDSIQDSFAPPETMSFWSLPAFINSLEQAGFTAVRHRLYLHSLFASPLMMCAMVLIAATFTLRYTRRGGIAYVISGGVLTGFALYLFSDIVFALGQSDSIPVILAAWTPSGVATLLGLAMLLHLEDG